METGVAREPIATSSAYRERLEALLSRRARGHAHGHREGARRDPKRIVFPEGEHPKILRAAKILVEEGIAQPILLGREARDRAARSRELELPMDEVEHRRPRDARRELPALRRSGSTSCGSARA